MRTYAAALLILLLIACGHSTETALDAPSPTELDFMQGLSINNTVILGTSITAICGGFYPEAFTGDIVNRGVCGQTSEGVPDLIAHVIQYEHPRAVVMEIGTNDHNLNSLYQNMVYNIALINLTFPDIEAIYIVNTEHINADVWSLGAEALEAFAQDDIIAKNEVLKSIAVLSPKIKYIDTSAALTEQGKLNQAYTMDGLHLNAEGCKIKFDAILKAIKN